MAYPARLEVTTLLSGPDGAGPDEANCLSNATADSSTLTPVADTSITGAAPPLFVIADTNKRAKSAGGVGSGRVVPAGLAGNIRPTPQGPTRLSVSPRPRSSPCIGRRYTRVTPLPATTPQQPSTECQPTHTLLSHVVDEIRESGKSSSPSKLPKWGRDRRKVSHFKKCSGGVEEDKEEEEEEEAPWPASSLDSEAMEIATSTPTQRSNSNPKEGKSPLWGGTSPWLGTGMYTVPTINIASDNGTPTQKQFRPYCASSASEKSDCITTLEHSRYVTERIHHLVTAFSQRASRVKAQITQPPTPSTELSDGADDQPKSRQRFDSMTRGMSSRTPSPNDLIGISSRKAWFLKKARKCKRALRIPKGMEPQSRLYISWLFMVSIVYVYNAWVIPLRSVFSHYQNESNLMYWLITDYLADFVYVMDIVLFKSRVKYLDNGFWVSQPNLMRKYYMNSSKFLFDVASLLPLDLLYIQFGPISVFRLPRLLKIHTFWEFFNRLDTVLSSPHAVRVIRTVLNMLYLIHLNTCAYFGFSKVEGIGSNKWVFQGVGSAYIRCFYFATKTATSIGKNPKPENESEYLFMTWSWLMGVFVFALLIGQIRDIVATATRNQNEYRYVMDSTQAYVQRLNVPPLLQERVRQWFTYTWQHKKTLDEMKWLTYLPRKMRTDIAINVHIQTLSKVQLFQDCDKALLRDLVLKLFPVLYLPGDFVCKKGEVGKEMYIVQTGQVMVMGGEKGDVVLATLGEGSVFGEISLLSLAGGNRRTANVKSRGFSNLFVLSKTDLQATIKDYPEAQEILKRKAKKLIRQNEAREKKETKEDDDDNVIIKSRESTPKLLHTVLQVVRPDSYTANVIRRSSKTFSRSTIDIPSSVSLSPGGNWSWTPSPRMHLSSASLEVPARNSRRSSLDVPSNASRAMIAKTSMSESLPEEDEEEFIVVETSEMGEGEVRPPGSPASQHSISLHRRSRSATPQSVFSNTPPPSTASSPNSERPFQQHTGTPQVDRNRPQQEAYFFNQHYQPSQNPPPKVLASGTSSPNSTSSLSRYSPATLTRQSCVIGIEASSPPHSGVPCSKALGQSNQFSDLLGSMPPKMRQGKELNAYSNLILKGSKDVKNGSGECGNRASSGQAKDLQNSNDQKRQHQGRKQSSRSASSHQSQPKSVDKSSSNEDKSADQVQKTNSKKEKAIGSIGSKCANILPGANSHENNKSESAHMKSSSSSSSNSSGKGIKSSRVSGSSKTRNSGTSRSENSKVSKTIQKPGGSSKLTYGRRSYTHQRESPNKATKSKESLNEMPKENFSDSPQHFNTSHQLKNLSSVQGGKNHQSSLRESDIPQDKKDNQKALLNHDEKPTSSSWPAGHQIDNGDHGEVCTLTLTKNLASSTDNILFKFGFDTSVETEIVQDSSNCFPSLECPSEADSYDLFYSELSKTMPHKQVPSAHSAASRSSSASYMDPTSPQGLTSSRIYCSAIVHREGTPSPDTSPSPFDAKESRL